MKELKFVLRTLNEYRKQDPKEFYGLIFITLLLFSSLYAALWIDAILGGNV